MNEGLDDSQRKWLAETFGRDVRFDARLSRYTTFGVGGPADALVSPRDAEAVSGLLKWATRQDLPWLVVGKGSNLLVLDGGWRGLAISLVRGFSRIEVASETAQRVFLRTGAGTPLAALCRYCVRKGFSGLTFATGIPGSVGGALFMNAGAHGGSMADVVRSMDVVAPWGEIKRVAATAARWVYRNMDLPPDLAGGPDSGAVITSCELELGRSEPERLERKARAFLELRKRKQPWRVKSAGCFFENPTGGAPAGALIDKAGLAGTSVGGAQVSQVHANFIVNTGNATADDILRLADEVRKTVVRKFGIELKPEVRVVGEKN
ncbi:MAG: UDP-N-acetylmuramate dehydrogenase [Desulfatibacillaceae bacterium]